MVKQIRRIYYNKKQQKFLKSFRVKIRVYKAGRAAGKTRIIPEDILQRAKALPRAKIALIGFTIDQIEETVLAECRDVFKLHGLEEGIHYVINEKPPAHFVLPYKQIENYDNSISFWNGFAVQIYSTAKNAKKIRGKSFDGLIVDEALNIKDKDFSSIIFPTVRGEDHWNNSPLWKLVSILSSHPRTAEGSWFLKYKKYAKLYPEKYAWVEATALDNLVVVGKDYVEDQRATLTYLDFEIEIMNRSDGLALPDRFYHNFKDRIHTYHSQLYQDTETYEPLDVSFDFGGNYSCMTVSQTQGYTERYLNEFDTNDLSEEERAEGKVKKLPHIVQDFIDFYSHHNCKYVNIYGDGYGLNKNVTDELNYYEQIERQFQEAGWDTNLYVEIARNPAHKSRHFLINAMLEQKIEGYPQLRINAELCPNLIVSMSHTRIKEDFGKDKDDERDKSFNQSLAPHLSDSLDYKLHEKYEDLLDDTGSGSGFGGGLDTV